MQSAKSSEWKPPSQDPEQPDDHGLCWRETRIGLLAFKTNEDGTTIWIQFDDNGNGTQVVFDEVGQAFYVVDEKMIPVPPLESDQPQEQPECEQPAAPVHSLEFISQETFGRGTTASQIELMTDAPPASEVAIHSEFSDSRALPGSELEADAPGRPTGPGLCEAVKTTRQAQSPQSNSKMGFPGSPSFASGFAGAHSTTVKRAKKQSFDHSLVAVQHSAGRVGELLSLWAETRDAAHPEADEQVISTQQLLARLDGACVPERLEKVAADEKTFSAAFEGQLTVLNKEMEKMQSTVTLAEQKLEQCYEAHRRVAELQTSILTAWPLAKVMQNVAKRAEAFFSSTNQK